MKELGLFERIMANLQAACKRIEESIEQSRNQENGRMELLEDTVSDVMKEMGATVMQEAVQMSLPETSRGYLPCQCGRKGKFISQKQVRKYTRHGEIIVRRTYFYCKHCRRGYAPEDRLYGLDGKKYSLRAYQDIVRMGVRCVSYNDACAELKERGIEVSDEQVRKLTNGVGTAVDREMKGRTWHFKPKEKVENQLYGSCDALKVNTRQGWRDMKLSGVYNQSRDVKRYGCHIGRPEQVGKFLRLEASQLGSAPEKMVAIGDGAPWVKNVVDKNLPGAEFILDFYHVSEHIGECAEKIFGKRDEKKRKAWLAKAHKKLKDEGGKSVCQWLRQWRWRIRESRQKAIKELLAYMEPRIDQMKYPEYLKRDLDIGSGQIESACKNVIARRLKGPGMRWNVNNATAVGQLRCMLHSDSWSMVEKLMASQAN